MNLKIIVNSKIARRIIKTILFYILSFIVLSILEKQSPSGPCVPGLGMLGFFLLIPISIVLFLINLYKSAEVDKVYLYSALIHLLIWAGIFLWLRIT
jgi:hypothetical protein